MPAAASPRRSSPRKYGKPIGVQVNTTQVGPQEGAGGGGIPNEIDPPEAAFRSWAAGGMRRYSVQRAADRDRTAASN